MLAPFTAFCLLALAHGQTITYPPYAVTGDSTVQFTLEPGGFDAPKVNFYNTTAAQWWYFDVVSNDLSQSAVISLLGNAPGATGSPSGVLPFNFIEVNLQLESGEQVALEVSAQWVILTTEGDGLSGVFNGSGYSWTGASDLSSYTVTIDDTANELSGTIVLNSVAPHHASCGPATVGASLIVCPHLGWGNSIPDADATVSLTYKGQQISYTGVGYHDTNYGDQAFSDDIGSWYWGHARFGPYSIVWFDLLDNTGVEHQLGYLAENGAVVANSCGSMAVRPTGLLGGAYPPVPGLLPDGFTIVYDMGSLGVLEVNITNEQSIVNYPLLYTRWVGNVVGGIRGQVTTYTGIGLYEEMGG
ncbi:hypothetical protein CALCODRAFT_461779 [Calocera cornea HHB12733]|uniref:AttH domain-containing protein n=1 Tax=Calocera cornea HHB12733 TaxID=1353952 RepID=A0A165C7Y6_9BASI|nr:hypothetical protein CALCODRAFT_461779 [Calocera cornea HHB12733]